MPRLVIRAVVEFYIWITWLVLAEAHREVAEQLEQPVGRPSVAAHQPLY